MKLFLITVSIIFVFLNNSVAKICSDSIKISEDSSVYIPDVYVNKIIIAGNKITDDDIVLRELTIKENSRLDFKLLQEDVQRIYNLGLFNKVDVIPVQTDSANTVNIMFLVEERFYIFPIPQGGFRNGNFSNFWIGLNLLWKNFRGRNETLSLSFGVGYEPFVGISYSIPWIGEKQHFFSAVAVNYSVIYNKSLQTLNDSNSTLTQSEFSDIKNNNFNASFTFGKYFSKVFSLNANLGYHLVKISDLRNSVTLSKDGKDNYLTFSAGGRYDTRNSSEYAMIGSLYTLEYIKYGFGKSFDFNRVFVDARRFIPVKITGNYSITLATRLLGVISFGGTIPVYLNQFYGYDKIIRGYKNIVLEGENQSGLFTELRIPVIDPFYLKGKDMPIARSVSLLKNFSYKFGLFATLFFDIGNVWNKNDNFFNTRFYNGFGAGLNFILPFGLVGRTDFAFRKNYKAFTPQVVFNLEASF